MKSPSHRAIAVVAVNWNRWRLSLSCLAALEASRGVEWHLFLVGNASTDDSREHLRNLGSDVTVILSPTNGGWTGGNNLGVRAALEAGYDHVFVLNNDAAVSPDTMATLLDAFNSDPSKPVLGPIQTTIDGQPDFVGASVDPRICLPIETKAHEIDWSVHDPIYKTAYIRGAGLFLHRAHFDQVGLFDDTYFLYYDDTDWCFQAAAKGFKVAMVRHASISHIGSASVGQASPLLIYFMVRNGLLFVERHGSLPQRARYAVWLLRWLGSLIGSGARARRLASLLLGGSGIAVAARRGVRDYLARRFGDCPPMIRRLSNMP